MSSSIYGEQVTLVHDAGHTDYARAASQGIIARLWGAGLAPGALVCDLGCGTGVLAEALVAEGFRVWGLDASEPMLAIARSRVPEAEFVLGDLSNAQLPACDAVVSTGHVVNYLPGPDQMRHVMAAIGEAVRSEGVCCIDVLTPACQRTDGEMLVRDEPGWFMLARFERPASERLVRNITVFCEEAEGWQRADERHVNVLYPADDVEHWLRRAGFAATVRPGFGEEVLGNGLQVLVCRKR